MPMPSDSPQRVSSSATPETSSATFSHLVIDWLLLGALDPAPSCLVFQSGKGRHARQLTLHTEGGRLKRASDSQGGADLEALSELLSWPNGHMIRVLRERSCESPLDMEVGEAILSAARALGGEAAAHVPPVLELYVQDRRRFHRALRDLDSLITYNIFARHERPRLSAALISHHESLSLGRGIAEAMWSSDPPLADLSLSVGDSYHALMCLPDPSWIVHVVFIAGSVTPAMADYQLRAITHDLSDV